MAVDINGTAIKLGNMLKFKEDRYTESLGIVKRFSVVHEDGVLVTICGGGGTGDRMISGRKSNVVPAGEGIE